MSGSQDGSLAVSTEDFLAALTGSAESDVEPTAATPEPVQPEASTPTPATPAAQADAPAETPPAQAPDELATLRAEMAALRQQYERDQGTYNNNTAQQREALEATKREAETARQELAQARQAQADAAKSRADEAERAFERGRQAWEEQLRTYPDGAEKTAARAWIDAQVMQHAAEQRERAAEQQAAEAQRLSASFAPVVRELQGWQAQHELTQAVRQNTDLIVTQGAEQLAAQVGAPVEEVRAYFQRPAIQRQYQQAFYQMKQAELEGRPVPVGQLTILGEAHLEYWAERMADRRAAEDRLVRANQDELVASGATRAEGGGAGGGRKSIDTFADVTPEMFARAAGIRRR